MLIFFGLSIFLYLAYDIRYPTYFELEVNNISTSIRIFFSSVSLAFCIHYHLVIIDSIRVKIIVTKRLAASCLSLINYALEKCLPSNAKNYQCQLSDSWH